MFNKIKSKTQKQIFISSAAIILIILAIILFSPSANKVITKIINISGTKGISSRYPSKMAIDKKKKTAWIPKSTEGGRYTKIKLTMQTTTDISTISLINGWSYKTYYEKHNRAKIVRIVFDDYTSYFWRLKDSRKGFQEFNLPQPHRARTITLYFHAIYRGTKYDQLAIPEIKIN